MKRALIALLIAGMLIPACGKKGPSPEEVEAQQQIDAFDAALGVSYSFDKSVRNDATGRWRMLRYCANKDFIPCVMPYYEAYFQDDAEVHAVVDLKYSTYMITCDGSRLKIRKYTYVEGEEHSAGTLGSGELLGRYEVDLKTGEVTEL